MKQAADSARKAAVERYRWGQILALRNEPVDQVVPDRLRTVVDISEVDDRPALLRPAAVMQPVGRYFFLLYSEHQPFGLIAPSTTAQLPGA